MASTFTPNVNIEEPARGDDVGTWDTPVNNNSVLLDLILGGTTTLSLNTGAGSVTLNAAQFQCAQITFNSTLLANTTIVFPSSFKKPYTIQNVCTGSSAFIITLAVTSTAAGGQFISCPPGQPFDIINDGTNIKFKNFGPQIGGYWDYAGSSVPTWASSLGNTVPPYLNCDGTTFSSATYPALAVILGSTTLPDARGRLRAVLNQGTGRLTSSQGVLDGNTNLAGGGAQTVTLTANNVPALGVTATSALQSGGGNFLNAAIGTATGLGGAISTPQLTQTTVISTGIANGSSPNTPVATVPPAYVGGLTLIRAA